MLAAEIQVGKIDEKRTFDAWFPFFEEKLARYEGENLAVRFLAGLGGKAGPVVWNAWSGLDQEEKAELLRMAAKRYEKELLCFINKTLKKSEIGRNFHISTLCVRREGEQLFVSSDGIRVDYQGLFASRRVKEIIGEAVEKKAPVFGGLIGMVLKGGGGLFAGALAAFSEEEIERQTLAFLRREETRRMLCAKAEKALGKKEIWVSLSGLLVRGGHDSAAKE